MRAGETEGHVTVARRPRPAPTIRALGVLAVLAAALLVITGVHDAPHAATVRTKHRAHRSQRVEVLGEQVARSAPTTPTTATSAPVVAPSTSTSTPTTTTSTSATTTTRPPVVPAAATASVPTGPLTTTCADALAYLAAHQAPGFSDSCADGSAQGHLGYTCVNSPGRCEGQRFVRIACPAPFVYMNEAHNSWVLIGQRSGIDPYGQGTAAEQAACAHHR